MNIVLKTDEFDTWLEKLKDTKAKVHILNRVLRAEKGNFGDHKNIEQDLYEMRINHGPGYRLYYTHKEGLIYLLLVGGDKSTQEKDISKAKAILKIILPEEHNEYEEHNKYGEHNEQ